MAKPYKKANTRLASTVNARYYQADGIVDGYFLDGRFPSKREQRAVDVTLDREDRGALLALYGRPDGEDSAWQASLSQLVSQIKSGEQVIDDELNTLADASLETIGRQTLPTNGREPYFAAVMSQDGEAVAITLGDAGAYLYRNDFLHALTHDDFPLESIDFNGNAVDLVDSYAAGSAGTVRYSNIVELEQNDVLIVCNKDVLEAVGQREFMRLLYEAEDINEAAGLIMTAASAKQPGVSMQIGLSFVDYIVPLDKRNGLNLGRFATASVNPQEVHQQVAKTAPPNRAMSSDQKTRQYDPDSLPRGARDERVSYREDRQPTTPTPRPRVSSETDRYSRMAAYSRPETEVQTPPVPQVAPTPKVSSTPQVESTPQVPSYIPRDTSPSMSAVEEGYRAASDRYKTSPVGSVHEQALRSAAQRQQGHTAHASERGARRTASYNDLNDPDGYEDFDDYDEFDDRSQTKKIIVLVLLGAIIIVSLYVLIRLLMSGGGTTQTTAATTPATPSSVPTTISSEPTVPTLPPSEAGASASTPNAAATKATAAPAVATTAAPVPAGSTRHTVTAGESWWSIAAKYYGQDKVNVDLCQRIAQANNKTIDTPLHEGEVIIIPPKP